MSMTINMPLGDLIDKSPKGEARFAHEEWLRTYVTVSYTHLITTQTGANAIAIRWSS